MSLTTTASLAGETSPPRPVCHLCGHRVDGLGVRGFSDHQVSHPEWQGCPEGPPPSEEGPLIAFDPLAVEYDSTGRALPPHASLEALERLARLGSPHSRTAVRDLPAVVHEFVGDFSPPVVRPLSTDNVRKRMETEGMRPLVAGPAAPVSVPPERYGGSKKARKT
jgi:hypothetical protein